MMTWKGVVIIGISADDRKPGRNVPVKTCLFGKTKSDKQLINRDMMYRVMKNVNPECPTYIYFLFLKSKNTTVACENNSTSFNGTNSNSNLHIIIKIKAPHDWIVWLEVVEGKDVYVVEEIDEGKDVGVVDFEAQTSYKQMKNFLSYILLDVLEKVSIK